TTVRRRFSVWKTAWHVTLALALADGIDTLLAYALASIETKGAYVEALGRADWSAVAAPVVILLIKSPIRFVGSAMLIALGRGLPRGGGVEAPSFSRESPGR